MFLGFGVRGLYYIFDVIDVLGFGDVLSRRMNG